MNLKSLTTSTTTTLMKMRKSWDCWRRKESWVENWPPKYHKTPQGIFSWKIWSGKMSVLVTWHRSTMLNTVWRKEQNPSEWSVCWRYKLRKNVCSRFFLADDPCTKIHCGAGRVCQVQDDSAQCVCIPDCPEETDPRRKVCTNRNETWGSDCEVHRQRCLCDTKDQRCTNVKNSHIHIDYYGECKELQVKYWWNYMLLSDIPLRLP